MGNSVNKEAFNLKGQEVPHLLGGGMNCPSAARLTFSLTYVSVYACLR